MENDEVRVAILEQKQLAVEHFEQIDEVLFTKIDELRDKMDSDHVELRARLSLLERRVWTAIGALGAVVIISNPQAIKLVKPLFSAAESTIIRPAIAFVDGSY